jgi:RNA polymerase sigma-70 factor, ECF subfamily
MPSDARPAKQPEDVLRDEDELRELMIRYQRADPQAVEELVARLSPMLYRFFYDPGQTKADTEDLLQECWLRIHRSRQTYSATEPVLPWIFGIARHTRFIGYKRRRRVGMREIGMTTVPERFHQMAPSANDGEEAMQKMLQVLPESQREVVAMLKISGMTLEEVARATSSSVGAVKLRAHRAYQKLRHILGGIA